MKNKKTKIKAKPKTPVKRISGLQDEVSPLVPVFLCMTDYDYHIPGDFHGVTVYFDEESLRANRKCVNKGCGIIKVHLDLTEGFIVQPENWELMRSSAVPMDEIYRREFINSLRAIPASFLKAFYATRRYIKYSELFAFFKRLPKLFKGR